MARDPDIDRRLTNWADWLAGLRSRGLGFGNPNRTEERVDGEGYDAVSRNPIFDDEAETTDKAVRALQEDLRKTVVAVYVGPGGFRQIARTLGITEVAVHARVSTAHYKIKVWLSEDTAAKRLKRERDEAMLSAARP